MCPSSPRVSSYHPYARKPCAQTDATIVPSESSLRVSRLCPCGPFPLSASGSRIRPLVDGTLLVYSTGTGDWRSGSAGALHAQGRGFEPLIAHQILCRQGIFGPLPVLFSEPLTTVPGRPNFAAYYLSGIIPHYLRSRRPERTFGLRTPAGLSRGLGESPDSVAGRIYWTAKGIACLLAREKGKRHSLRLF